MSMRAPSFESVERRVLRPRRRGRALVSVLAVSISAALGVGVGVVLSSVDVSASASGPASAESTVVDSEPSSSALALGATAAASGISSASPSGAALTSAPSPQPSAIDPEVCARSLFPPETFRSENLSFGFVCETPTFPASRRVKKLVVQSGAGTVNDAMREWSQLGYYQVGATAVLEQRCCTTPPPSELPPLPKSCGFEAALDALRAWVRDPSVEPEPVVQSFTKAARCVARGVEGEAFDVDPPSGGQDVVFRKTLERARAAR